MGHTHVQSILSMSDLAQEEGAAAALDSLPGYLPGYLHLAFQLAVWNRHTRLTSARISGKTHSEPLILSLLVDKLALDLDDRSMHSLSTLGCLRLALSQSTCYLTQASSEASGGSSNKDVIRPVSSDSNTTVCDHACNEDVCPEMPAAACSPTSTLEGDTVFAEETTFLSDTEVRVLKVCRFVHWTRFSLQVS